MHIVTSFSGGLDSTTLLAFLLAGNHKVSCVSFNYGSKHNSKENEAARKLAKYYNVDLKEVNVENIIGSLFKSDLLKSGGDIPEGHYEADNMKSTVVPARNLIFASILAGYADSIKADAVALGVHSGDHHIYKDCRTEFVKALDSCIYLATDNKIEVMAPFAKFSKTLICKLGLNLKVPYELTWTCYKGLDKACGVCGSCTERLEAFKLCGSKDPIEYMDK